MRLELQGDDVVLVDGDVRTRIGTASLTRYGHGGSMDRDTWGEAELFCSAEEIVVVIASVDWPIGDFSCEFERWVSRDGGAAWVQATEAQDLENARSLSFVTSAPSGKRSRMVAAAWIRTIWATIRESAPFLPEEYVRGWAVSLSGGVGPLPERGGKAALERAKERIGELPLEKRAPIMRRLTKVIELEELP